MQKGRLEIKSRLVVKIKNFQARHSSMKNHVKNTSKYKREEFSTRIEKLSNMIFRCFKFAKKDL